MSVIIIVIHKSLAVIFYLLSAVDWITVNSNTLSTSIFHYHTNVCKFSQLSGSYIFARCWQITFKFGNLTDIKTLFSVRSTDFHLCQKLNPFITASADGSTLVQYVLLLLLIIIIIDRELYALKTEELKFCVKFRIVGQNTWEFFRELRFSNASFNASSFITFQTWLCPPSPFHMESL